MEKQLIQEIAREKARLLEEARQKQVRHDVVELELVAGFASLYMYTYSLSLALGLTHAHHVRMAGRRAAKATGVGAHH